MRAELQTGDDGGESVSESVRDGWTWWESRRLRYNVVVLAGAIPAFFLYCALFDFIVSHTPPERRSEVDITLFTTAFQGCGWMFLANLFCLLGVNCERYVKPERITVYREKAYRRGCWFAFLIPFAVPLLVFLGHVGKPVYHHIP